MKQFLNELVINANTDKPVLTITSEQRPPLNNGQPEVAMTILNLTDH